jgi:hypothetical protein
VIDVSRMVGYWLDKQRFIYGKDRNLFYTYIIVVSKLAVLHSVYWGSGFFSMSMTNPFFS